MSSLAASRLCMVTTNFNYGDYLEDCIKSIVHSKGAERVDYVMMDGGSTDQSLDIIKKYSSHFKHSQSAKDEGMYHAIAEGFKKSNAAYMGWLNSDDQLTPWTIQTVLDIFDQLPHVRWITSRYPLQARKDGVVIKSDFLPGVDNWGFFNGEHIKSSGLPTSGWVVQDCTFWRRDLWDEVGGTFDFTLKLAGDFELWARFMQKTDLYVVNVPFGIYRFHGANKAVTGRDAYRDECVKVLNRYTPVIPSSIEMLGQRVIAKHLKAIGFGNLVDKSWGPSLKTIVFSHADGRYHTVDVE
ncbi:MAG: glycosyltransferase [Rhodospirillaceae bacterium]|nr:glycosyltransferase [Rhodospirillaceae bacterium]